MDHQLHVANGGNIQRTIYQKIFHKRSDHSQASGMAALETATIVDGSLNFADADAADRALDAGVFLLMQPPGLDLSECDAFAQQFYRGADCPPYGQFRTYRADRYDDPLLGFHERSDQIEQFLLERRFWSRDYPAAVWQLAETLTELSRIVLRDTLSLAGLPGEFFAQATGGCMEGEGSYHLTFNHYRPANAGVGLSSHKDDGFVTLLRITSPGLEVNRTDRWETVPIIPGTFVINFGLAMEMLTRHCPRPVAAILHRVCQQTHDRWSYGHFTSSRCQAGADAGIYQFVPTQGLQRICDSRVLIDSNDAEIYLGTTPPDAGNE